MNNAPIGIYDSGLGGLTVWREVRRLLPEESLLYLGDGKNCPYGSRPREEVRALADAAVARLVEEGCKLVVVACNTATAAAIDFLRANYAALPIVGMEPAVKPACQNTRSGVVGVLATERSLEGDLFHRTAARDCHDVTIIAGPGRGLDVYKRQERGVVAFDLPARARRERKVAREPVVALAAERDADDAGRRVGVVVGTGLRDDLDALDLLRFPVSYTHLDVYKRQIAI